MSQRFRSKFSNRHVVLPVIHAVSASQALANVEVARNCHCDGVFLINHAIDHAELMECHAEVTTRHPGFWVGVNSLGTPPERLLASIPTACAGVWADNAGIDERMSVQAAADKIDKVRRDRGWNGIYFGGVAFKYQRRVEHPGDAARIAMRHVDVITTSGEGTGKAADVGKIRAMKAAVGEFPLAIASGITPENVTDYLPIADCFLVATGIGSSFTELDAARVAKLVDRVRAHA